MRTALAAFLLASVAVSQAAAAPPPCKARSEIVQALTMKYGEKLWSWALDENGSLFEFWANRRGTWTILATTPDGISCVMKAGDGAVLPGEDL